MLTLSIDHIYSLEDNRELQERVVQAEALVFCIDFNHLSLMIDEHLSALENNRTALDAEWHENNADEWMAAISSPKLAFLSNLLSENNTVNYLELRFSYGAYSWANLAQYMYCPDFFVKGLFQGLGSIPRPIDKQCLYLGCCESEIDSIFHDNDGVIERVSDIIRNQPLFQQIKQLELKEESDGDDVGISQLWGNLFGWFFEAIPNKEQIESLSLKLRSNEWSNEILLQQVIHECNQLSSFSLDANYLDDDLCTRIGNFIQFHPTMHSIAIDSMHAINSVQFLINALDNKRLIAVSLTISCIFEDEFRFLAQKIKCLAGLVRLKLIADISYGVELQLPLFLRSIAANPTLSDLTLYINDVDVTPMAEKALAKNKKLRTIDTNDAIYNSFFGELTQRNSQLADTYKPFFALNTEANLSGVKLIEMNSIWLSIMASYRLTPPENQILAEFQNNYFILVLGQFFTQISHAKLQRLPTDVCHVIAEYTDMYFIAKLNAVTGGYFFRQVKPLKTDNQSYNNESSLSSV